MPKFHITHETTYSYAEEVLVSEHYFFCNPINNQFQRVETNDSKISADGKKVEKTIYDHEDSFGNNSIYFDNKNKSLSLNFNIDCKVETCSKTYKNFLNKIEEYKNSKDEFLYLPCSFNPNEQVALTPYLQHHHSIKDAKLTVLTDLAKSFKGNIFKKVEKLLTHINSKYKYDVNSANVDNSPFDLYMNEKGVCHDFTNFFIAVCRILGIPARFCCGYHYRNESFNHQLHSWAEIYIPRIGWVGVDPSSSEYVDENYIKLSQGVEYFDCAPVRGIIFKGGEGERLDVNVLVKKI